MKIRLVFQDPQTNRTLTLISKTIQSLGNLVSSRSAHQVCKEEYMAELYRSFCTPRHVCTFIAGRLFLSLLSRWGKAAILPITKIRTVLLYSTRHNVYAFFSIKRPRKLRLLAWPESLAQIQFHASLQNNTLVLLN